MEDEGRALPAGWLRQYDPETQHQFFVDTNTNPPRSIWQHPHDDATYLASLPAPERTKLQAELLKVPSAADVKAESSEDDFNDKANNNNHNQLDQQPQLPPRRPSTQPANDSLTRLGRRMKDKLTSSTHAERETERA